MEASSERSLRAREGEGLRERLARLGEERLSDAECLALLLGCGGRGESALRMAVRILEEAGGLAVLAGAGVGELSRFRGVKLARAASLAAAFGLARRLADRNLPRGRRLAGPHDAARYLGALLRGRRREEFHAVYLDVRHRVLKAAMVSAGSMEASLVHPREVFLPAVREGASALVVGHNHPSGDPTPSAEDEEITERLRAVGQLVGIQLLDHLVLGERAFYSFTERRTCALPGSPPRRGTACAEAEP